VERPAPIPKIRVDWFRLPNTGPENLTQSCRDLPAWLIDLGGTAQVSRSWTIVALMAQGGGRTDRFPPISVILPGNRAFARWSKCLHGNS